MGCTELTNKARTLEIDVDKFGEKLAQQVMAQEAKEAQVMAAEAEFNRLNRRVQELEEDLEITEAKYATAIQKYDKAATEADDSDRMAKVLANRAGRTRPRRRCRLRRPPWRLTARGQMSVSSRSSSWRR